MKFIPIILFCLLVSCKSNNQQEKVPNHKKDLESVIVVPKPETEIQEVVVEQPLNNADSIYALKKEQKMAKIKARFNDCTIYEQPISLYLNNKKVDSIVVDFCEGRIYPSDDEITFNLLESLTKKSDELAPLYYTCFEYLCSQSDGALGEIMGMYAKEFILNNPSFSIEKCGGHCIDHLAFEFAINGAWKYDIKEFSDSLRVISGDLVDSLRINEFIEEVRKATLEAEKDLR
ncbi:hypothetical protein DF185_16515 [Marinifilum breve]|uniref:Lipoprotein n=1 Tax=Marinifilum breve TaxID=2184082 RepID=A0A2V3ZU53_9BACT|nr:hypothetical protein [Marinifilum breve]PXX97941.1 hypothetical protein DF185_16515 [Marinifilum breve]